MKNRTQMMSQRSQIKSLDWLLQEEQEDFLMGKTPKDFPDTWEDEE